MRNAESHKLFEQQIEFHGHPNIRGAHRNTIEVTKSSEISTRADCIIGVKANAACSDLSQEMKDHIRSGRGLVIELDVAGETFSFSATGIKNLPLTNTEELVLRRSEFVSDRTAAGNCAVAAIDIPRTIIAKLRNPRTTGLLIIMATNETRSPPVMNSSVLEM